MSAEYNHDGSSEETLNFQSFLLNRTNHLFYVILILKLQSGCKQCVEVAKTNHFNLGLEMCYIQGNKTGNTRTKINFSKALPFPQVKLKLDGAMLELESDVTNSKIKMITE